jgi:ribosomal protein S18 acetylase RimI-like enzyme
MIKIEDTGALNDIIREHFIRKTVTNNYVLADAYSRHIAEGNLYSITENGNAFILLKREDHYRMFYYLNNLENPGIFDCNLPVVMEILYRGEAQVPEEIFSYWKKRGFRRHLTRDLMTAVFSVLKMDEKKNPGIIVKYAETDDEASFIKKLSDSVFDKYTGDILSFFEVKSFTDSKNILCAYFNNEIAGMLQFETRNNIIWLGHIAVDTGFRGNGIANALVKAYIKSNYAGPDSKYHLWVIQDNIAAISMYKKFGFIYGNKTSASMLKE